MILKISLKYCYPIFLPYHTIFNHEILVYFTILNHEILVYFSLSIDLWKLNDYKFHMVYDFMHQRMILFVLYGLFHKFHANVAFPAIYAHFLPNRKYRKYRVIIVSKPKISCNIVWTQKNDIAQGWSKDTFCARHRLRRTQIIWIESNIWFFQFSMSDISEFLFCRSVWSNKFEYFCSWKV